MPRWEPQSPRDSWGCLTKPSEAPLDTAGAAILQAGPHGVVANLQKWWSVAETILSWVTLELVGENPDGEETLLVLQAACCCP